MKKRSTLVFIVKKYAGQQSKYSDSNYRDFLASADDEAGFAPSDQSIKNIMDFASSYEVLSSDSAGQIELINN